MNINDVPPASDERIVQLLAEAQRTPPVLFPEATVLSLIKRIQRADAEFRQLQQRISPETESCHCPDFCNFHKRQRFEELTAELAKYKDECNQAACVYCGWIGPKEADAIIEHVKSCEKNPWGALVKELNLEQIQAALFSAKWLVDYIVRHARLHATDDGSVTFTRADMGKMFARCEVIDKVS